VILVDSSVWIDHLHRSDDILAHLLDQEQVMIHPYVIGELAIGNLRSRPAVLRMLQRLDQITVARDAEVLRLIEQERLFGLGLGYVDAHLLASTRLTPEARLWSRDRRLAAAAERLSLAARVTH
jgi:predicted nucleic acid-binding protein